MKNIKKLILVCVLLTLNLSAQTLKDFVTNEKTTKIVPTQVIKEDSAPKPFYEGEVVDVKQAQAYTYIEVREKTHKPFWIATNSADVKKGDFIRFQKELVMKNFKSKALDIVFEELMFASSLQHRVKQ